MQQLDEESPELEPVLAALEGDDCTHCDSGTLTRDVYKGDDAVVCEACGVPGARSL
ncbi:HVO_A0556 family zinc finger protein [Saliphagus infecundisoli]|uniref:HVO_A0556 family zinc finger protein n=1 Tax=Saliphagus infecundisoli TaxID=1849069 RepID=A0ABD5QIK9_9EURY|nr:HVO_A0556 family zinc finger protein [Saliphagus infecundisoli]